MKAFTLDGFGASPTLRDDLPEPSPAAGQLSVRVQASSVNPVDVFIAAGALEGMAEHEFPVVIGRDFAGVVEETGAAVTRFQAGDEVFGFLLHANPAVHEGSWAELIAVPEDDFVAARPRTVGVAEAGAAPLASITALAALDALALAPGESVLVVGATGGVGSAFVQLAAAAGAEVVAPALAEDEACLRRLGVGTIVDRDGNLAEAVRATHPGGVDAMFDLVSRPPDHSLLKDGGRLASPLGAAGDGPGRFNIMAVPSPENLARVADLLDAGTLRVEIARIYPFGDAAEALRALPATHVRGKLALAFS